MTRFESNDFRVFRYCCFADSFKYLLLKLVCSFSKCLTLKLHVLNYRDRKCRYSMVCSLKLPFRSQLLNFLKKYILKN